MKRLYFLRRLEVPPGISFSFLTQKGDSHAGRP